MNSYQRCDGMKRRNFIEVGGLTALGVGIDSLYRRKHLHAGPTKALRSATSKACILIWLDGGASHLDTFDPKPLAPSEVRGPFDSIDTNLPGVRISEHLPLTAKILHKISLIRSVTSPFGVHNCAIQYLMTGHKPTPALQHPTIGSVVSYLHDREGVLPANIAIPNLVSRDAASIGNGFLPNATKHFSLQSDPGKANYRVRDLNLYQGLDFKRLARRRSITNALNRLGTPRHASKPISDANLERAYNLITSENAKKAFNLDEEPTKVRERYSIDPRANLDDSNNIGQQCLLARRLVERGVSFVTVNNTGWDNHLNLKTYANRNPGDPRSASHALIPGFDKAFSGLIQDLSERGMLEETLVLVMTDFGRTPKINSTGGRDHWPNCFSVALAGGGVQGGQVIGESDALGEFVTERPITPSDLTSTVFTLLGIDPDHELVTPDGRPIRVAPQESKPIMELLA